MAVLCLPTESHTWSPVWSAPCGPQVAVKSQQSRNRSLFPSLPFCSLIFLKIKDLLLLGHIPSCSVLPYVLPLLRLPSAVVKGVECVGVGRGPICRQAPRTLRRWAEKMRTPTPHSTPEPRSVLLPPAGPAKFREKFPEN